MDNEAQIFLLRLREGFCSRFDFLIEVAFFIVKFAQDWEVGRVYIWHEKLPGEDVEMLAY
jgi:hypothetical protein